MIKRIVVTSAILISTQLCAASTDLAGLHEKLIKFYGYQRAGLKSGSCHNLNSNFTNASHGGDNYNGSPLDGGWYDAGDYVKFGMNLAYTVYCLLKGYDAFPSGYSNKYSWDYGGADDIPDILNEVKFATDYICKVVINENTVILDVGDGNAEHGSWAVANNPSGRTGYPCTGADIPAEYAADLALMSTLYRKYDAKYADTCLAKAKIAFAFAKKKFTAGGNNLYCTPRGGFYDYNKENGEYIRSINDKMVAAGVELLRATKGDSPEYEQYASMAIPNFSNCMSYSYIGPLASFETWRQDVGARSGSLANNVGFIATKLKTSGMFNKVYQNSGWGTARDVGAAGFTYGLAYATTSSQDTRDLYLSRVKDHVNWVTGTNSKSQSFICGVGSKSPTSIHYRTTNYGPVPGAVVAGPDDAGEWQDDGKRYEYTEVAIDYNAGIIGAVAFLRAITSDDPNEVKMVKAFTADPTNDVDLSKKSVTLTATLSKSVKWTIDIIGAYGSKTISKTGTTISETWDGSADKGAFLSGETVRAKFSIDGIIAVYDILKASPQSIIINNSKTLPKKDADVLVDDFEDKDSTSKLSSKWTSVGTYTASLQKSKFSITTDSGSKVLYWSGFDNSRSNETWSGVKIPFNKDNAPASVGNIPSIYFSAHSDKNYDNLNLSVELEQSTITDSAYYCAIVPIKAAKNFYRINIADMKQPDWKTADKPLDLTKISALRFVVYDSIGTFKVYLDNVAIENLGVGTIVLSNYKQPVFSRMTSENQIHFTLPQNSRGILELSLFNISGRLALHKTYNTEGVTNLSLPVSSLPSGTYTLISKINGTPVGNSMKIIRTR